MRRRKPPKLRANGSAGDAALDAVERLERRFKSAFSVDGGAKSAPLPICGPLAVGRGGGTAKPGGTRQRLRTAVQRILVSTAQNYLGHIDNKSQNNYWWARTPPMRTMCNKKSIGGGLSNYPVPLAPAAVLGFVRHKLIPSHFLCSRSPAGRMQPMT